ncbi:hypothetical protein KA005_15210, partial [bacterium]|nr:hypothetical protein [bacterium]
NRMSGILQVRDCGGAPGNRCFYPEHRRAGPVPIFSAEGLQSVLSSGGVISLPARRFGGYVWDINRNIWRQECDV